MSKIYLDGKNNIIHSMYADLPNNNSTKTLSEDEKQKITEQVNKQVTYDWYHKPVLKIKRIEETGYEDYEIDMTKARPTKYIRREPDGKGGWKYWYREGQGKKGGKAEENIGLGTGKKVLINNQKDKIDINEENFFNIMAWTEDNDGIANSSIVKKIDKGIIDKEKNIGLKKNHFEIYNTLKKYIQNAPKYNGEIFRVFEDFKDQLYDSVKENDIFEIDSMSSFSAPGGYLKHGSKERFNLKFIIANNTRGVDISPFSLYKHEKEIVIPKGKYKIIKKEKIEKEWFDKTIIYLEEID
jgi:hypothetical protein